MATKARYRAYVHTYAASTTWKLYSCLAAHANFGTTVEATEADFTSVREYDEGNVSVTGTGWVTWEVNTAHLPAVGSEIFFRIKDTNEGDYSVVANAIRSADYTGTSYDPYLEIYEESDSTPMRTLTGCGT